MVRVYKMKNYNIYSDMDGSYIVHNTNKPFENGHTHINNFDTAKYVLYLSLYRRLPKNNHLSIYLCDSIIRISDDKKYIDKMKSFKLRMIQKKEPWIITSMVLFVYFRRSSAIIRINAHTVAIISSIKNIPAITFKMKISVLLIPSNKTIANAVPITTYIKYLRIFITRLF